MTSGGIEARGLRENPVDFVADSIRRPQFIANSFALVIGFLARVWCRILS